MTARSILLLLLAFGFVAPSDQSAAYAGPVQNEVDHSTESKRDRWRTMSAGRKRQLRRLAEAIQELPPERREALLRRARRLTQRHAQDIKRRMRAHHNRSERERARVRTDARRMRLIAQHLSTEERNELRDAPPVQRKQLIRRHTKRLLEEFKRKMEPSTRRTFPRLAHPEKISRFERYLKSGFGADRRAMTGRDRSYDRELQRDQRQQRIRRIHGQLRRFPGPVRMRLIDNPDSDAATISLRLREELKKLSPREKSQLKQIIRRSQRSPRRR